MIDDIFVAYNSYTRLQTLFRYSWHILCVCVLCIIFYLYYLFIFNYGLKHL